MREFEQEIPHWSTNINGGAREVSKVRDLLQSRSVQVFKAVDPRSKSSTSSVDLDLGMYVSGGLMTVLSRGRVQVLGCFRAKIEGVGGGL